MLNALSSPRRECELEGAAVALRVGGLDLDVARALRGVDLELEEAVARGQRLATAAADDVARLGAAAHQVDAPGDVLDLHVRDGGLLARAALADDDELLRLAPVARLTRLRDGQDAPEVVALAEGVDRQLGRLQLVALDEHPGGDEER